MAVEVLDDIIEQLANEMGVYGCHTEEHPDEQLEASAQPAAEQQTLEGTEPPKRGRGRRVAPFVVPGGSQAEATQ